MSMNKSIITHKKTWLIINNQEEICFILGDYNDIEMVHKMISLQEILHNRHHKGDKYQLHLLKMNLKT